MKKRILSFGIVAALALSLFGGTALAVEDRASTTIAWFTASASKGSNAGELKISYDVQASGLASELGIFYIEIYKSDGTYDTTIVGSTDNGLVHTDATRHRSSYIYEGESGESYYAVVTGFATIHPNSDHISRTTATVTVP